MWISDDDGRVPLKVVAKTDYGDIEMQITDYSPGPARLARRPGYLPAGGLRVLLGRNCFSPLPITSLS